MNPKQDHKVCPANAPGVAKENNDAPHYGHTGQQMRERERERLRYAGKREDGREWRTLVAAVAQLVKEFVFRYEQQPLEQQYTVRPEVNLRSVRREHA